MKLFYVSIYCRLTESAIADRYAYHDEASATKRMRRLELADREYDTCSYRIKTIQLKGPKLWIKNSKGTP